MSEDLRTAPFYIALRAASRSLLTGFLLLQIALKFDLHKMRKKEDVLAGFYGKERHESADPLGRRTFKKRLPPKATEEDLAIPSLPINLGSPYR